MFRTFETWSLCGPQFTFKIMTALCLTPFSLSPLSPPSGSREEERLLMERDRDKRGVIIQNVKKGVAEIPIFKTVPLLPPCKRGGGNTFWKIKTLPERIKASKAQWNSQGSKEHQAVILSSQPGAPLCVVLLCSLNLTLLLGLPPVIHV